MNVPCPWLRGGLSGIAGGLAWLIGIQVFFGPAQAVLTNPDLQSAKMLEAFTTGPAPRAGDTPWVVPVGILAIGILWGWIYVWLSKSWSGTWWRRGLKFGVVSWILMVPWFEFYLPWNVLWEPAPLVALELGCWAGVLLGVGVAVAGVEAALRRGRRPSIG